MKSTVNILFDDKLVYQTHNDFMFSYSNRLAGWLASSSTIDRSRLIAPRYLAIGLGTNKEHRNVMESEVLRVPIDAKYIEPVSSRTRILISLRPTDMSSIPISELGLYDDTDLSIILNKCDTLGKWTTTSGARMYASKEDSVQDEAAIFVELPITTSASTLFKTIDLSDGKDDKIKDGTSTKLPAEYSAHVGFTSPSTYTRTATNVLICGIEESNTPTYRTALKFNLTDLPSDSTFTGVSLAGLVSYLNPTASVNIGPYANDTTLDPATDTAENMWRNASHTQLSLGTITSLYLDSGIVEKTGAFDIDLGSTAVSNLQTSFSSASKTFAIGITEDSESTGERFDLTNLSLNCKYTRSVSLGINAKLLGKDSDILQFFLFISRIDGFSTDTVTVILSSSTTDSTSQWSWDIRPSSMQAGWNFIQLPLGEATITGTPLISHLKRFEIKVDGITTPMIAGIDNIRLFRNNGILMNRVVLDDKITKPTDAAVTIQWIIDMDAGI